MSEPTRSPGNGSVVAVSGATGFLGSRLVERLHGRGTGVVAIARRGSDVTGLPHSVPVVVDEADPARLTVAMANLRVNAVIHLASRFVAHHTPADVQPMIEANVGFSTRLAQAASDIGCRVFINVGTAWQHLGGVPYAPVSLYAASKQAFEDILQHYRDNCGLPAVTVKLFDTYGPGDSRRKLLPLLLEAERTGTAVELSSGLQLIDLVHVDDVCAGFEHMLDTGLTGGPFALSADAAITVRELVEIFQRVRETRLEVRFGARQDRPNEMRERWTVADPLPGWSPVVGLEAGLAGL